MYSGILQWTDVNQRKKRTGREKQGYNREERETITGVLSKFTIMSLHIYPLNDTKEHDLETSMCKCWPEIKIENGELMIIHKSFDGREHRELSAIEAYGCENRTIYVGDDIAKNSMVYYNFINGNDFSIEQVLDIRLSYMNLIKESESSGKEILGLESDYCRKEIAGCDLIMSIISKQ